MSCDFEVGAYARTYELVLPQRRYDKLIRAYAPTLKSHDTHGIPDILSSYIIHVVV